MNVGEQDLAEIKELLRALPGQLAASLSPALRGSGSFGQAPNVPNRIVGGVPEYPTKRQPIPQEKVMGNLFNMLFPTVSRAADDFHNKNFPVYPSQPKPLTQPPPLPVTTSPLPSMARNQAPEAPPAANVSPSRIEPPAAPVPPQMSPPGSQPSPEKQPEPSPAPSMPTKTAPAFAQRPTPASSLAARIMSIPKAVGGYAKGMVSKIYHKAEDKYGPKWAKAIAATAIVTMPTPFTLGATAAMTGIAHLATMHNRKAAHEAAQFAQPMPAAKQEAPSFAPPPQAPAGVSSAEHKLLVKQFGLKQANIIAAHAATASPSPIPPVPQAAPLRGSPSLRASDPMAPGVAGGFDTSGGNADLINTLKDLVKEIKDLKAELGKSDAPGIGKDGSFKPGGSSPMNAHPGAQQPNSSTVPRASQGGAGPWMGGVLRALGG